MRFFVVDLPSLLQRALMPRAGHAALPHPVLHGMPVQAPLNTQGDQVLQAVADLDGNTLWPTHRIRCYLHGQPSALARSLPKRPL